MSEPSKTPFPNGWTTAPLGQLTCEAVQCLGPTDGEPFVYVDIGSVNNQTKRIESPKRLTAEKAPSRAKQNLESGDVLVSMTRPNLNSVALVTDKFDDSVGSTGFHVLRPVLMTPAWIFHAVQTSGFVADMSALVQGALYPAVRPRDIDAWQCPVPPSGEQERIADTLDELFSDLEAGVVALERVQKKLTHYRAAVLKAAVEGDLTADWRAQHPDTEPASELLPRILIERRRRWEEDQLRKYKEAGKEPPKNWKARYREPGAPDTKSLSPLPSGWCWATVEQLGDVQLGRQRAPQHHQGEFMRPYLRVANVYEGRIDTRSVYDMNFTPAEYETFRLINGDILLNEGQSLELVGRSAIYRDEVPGACFTNTLVRFRADEGVLVEFAQTYFTACLRSHRFRRIARWTTNIAHLGADRFAVMEFPLPPIAEQEAIVEAVDAQLSVINHLDADIAAKLKSALGLRQSILRHAFTGQLVPQDPNDEPASELLKRIAIERGERARMTASARLATKTAREQAAKPPTKKAVSKRARKLT